MSGHSRSNPRPVINGVSVMDVMDGFDLMPRMPVMYGFDLMPGMPHKLLGG